MRRVFIALIFLMSTAIAATDITSTPRPLEVEQPDMVVIAGNFQALLGCKTDWNTTCAEPALIFSEGEDIWRGEIRLPAGEYEYKVAINGTWDENYGGQADPGGPNVALVLERDTTVRFYYDHFTHWVADSVGDLIVTAPGNYQRNVNCPEDMGVDGGIWAPECMRSWLQDPDGDGVYVFSTEQIAAGDWEVKIALNESWSLNYGANSARDGANIPFSVPADGTIVHFAFNSSSNLMSIGVGEAAQVEGPRMINLDLAQAHWVSASTIAWDTEYDESLSYALYYDPAAGLDADNLTNAESVALSVISDGLTDDVVARFPHLAEMTAFMLAGGDSQTILRSQMVVAAVDDSGEVMNATGVQIPGVLDDLFTYDGDLGVTFDGDTPTIRVWSPTAQSVHFQLYAEPDAEPQVFDMDYDAGVWSITGEPEWRDQYYLFEVEVFAPTVRRIVTNQVTDPYSLSLSTNSRYSQIMDLNDPDLMPEGWLDLKKPALDAPEDIVVYELHIRDFSVNDPLVPDEFKGTFRAFTVDNSNGMTHLRALADAGLTHLHMLPLFDIATINEDAAERVEPNMDELAALPPTSDQQQALIDPIRDQDAFNWGYDPLHYTVPEGSYATDPDQRILEFRQMVQALNQAGLRVVMDMVYNHTNASGQSDNSVLDRIVPGYYHRLDADGFVATSTCCANTATEHNMMRKLMLDSVRVWARDYKVDGFRFDLMGHHMKSDMEQVRATLDSLTLAEDGVDGASVYVYGEGWDFGEVEDNTRGVNATQINMAGTGIGTFNDRVRDAVRGGGPFSEKQEQGFVTGMYLTPNAYSQENETDQLPQLLTFTDQIRVALAGNLGDYTFTSATGEAVTGADILYNGDPSGYNADPEEHIVYVAAHDNETLWDAIQYKAPESATIADRVRMNNLALSIVGLSQGVPFFHAGDDMLRSKSLDRDSYNSGDWFNRLDFTYQDNNWAVGLPPSSESDWDLIETLLSDPELAVSNNEIQNAMLHLREILAIRKSIPLLRLRDAEAIYEHMVFHNTGPDQIPGVIVMSVDDSQNEFDMERNLVVVVFNANPALVELTLSELSDRRLELHDVQQTSHDLIVRDSRFDDGTFTIPGRTTAVFVEPRATAAGGGLVAGLVVALSALLLSVAAFATFSQKAETGP